MYFSFWPMLQNAWSLLWATSFALWAKLNQTNFMELSPSWEVANCAATEALTSILWNPKVDYCVHSAPVVLILSQIDPVRTTPSCLSKNDFNIVHPPMS
jgi:hypothetical protein